MASLKEVRLRIASVNSTQQITKAMKMVSAAKLRRAQDAIIQMRPYASKLRELLENLSSSVDASESGGFAVVRPANRILIVAITSNRGLAGAFNSNIIRFINHTLEEEFASQFKAGNVKVLCIGKKATDFFSKKPALFTRQYNDVFNNLTFENAAEIASRIMEEFSAGIYDRVILVYNQFKNAAVQYVVNESYLPITPPVTQDKMPTAANDYIFEPDKAAIVQELIPRSLKTQLFKALLDSNASEHGARMTAMSKATDNAGELLHDLRLQYNKARQAAITNEILEIVGGAEALEG
ncbi:MAG: ATP synthase F1 subunit gamma [Bacteroidia bacterium]|nr:ATP synthase F1 subunit gamma [Bacteroidia bacterium]